MKRTSHLSSQSASQSVRQTVTRCGESAAGQEEAARSLLTHSSLTPHALTDLIKRDRKRARERVVRRVDGGQTLEHSCVLDAEGAGEKVVGDIYSLHFWIHEGWKGQRARQPNLGVCTEMTKINRKHVEQCLTYN